MSHIIDHILLKLSQFHKTVKFSPQHLILGMNYIAIKFYVGTNLTSLHSLCTALPKSIVLEVWALILPAIKSAFLIPHMHTAQYAHSTFLHCITLAIFRVLKNFKVTTLVLSMLMCGMQHTIWQPCEFCICCYCNYRNEIYTIVWAPKHNYQYHKQF